MKLILVLCLFAIGEFSVFAEDSHYVDAVNGRDTNNGLFPTQQASPPANSWDGPWQTIAKVNSHSYIAGDQILFARGQTHCGEISIPSNGESGNPIIIDNYDIDPLNPAAENPIITTIEAVPGWNNASNWKRCGIPGNDTGPAEVWYMTVPDLDPFANEDGDPTRLWLDGKEYVEVDAVHGDQNDIDDHYRWYFDVDVSSRKLYVYSPEIPADPPNQPYPIPRNPADYYSGITGLQMEQHTMNFGNREYITVQGLTILGGYNGGICIMRGSHDITIQNCVIGNSCKGLLLQGVGNNSEFDLIYNIKIINNDICAFGLPHPRNPDPSPSVVHPTLALTYNYYFPNISDGIYLWSAEDVEIANNVFCNWGHADIELSDDNYGLKRVDIHDNLFFGGHVDYTRALCYNGREPDKVKDIAFYKNSIKNKNVRNQINGEQMLFYDNIIDTVTQSPAFATGNRGTGQGLNLYSRDGWPNASNNIIAFNTISNCKEPGLSIWNMTTTVQVPIENNWIVNNYIYNCGTDINGLQYYQNYLSGISLDIEEFNPQVNDPNPTGYVGSIKNNKFLNNRLSTTTGGNVVNYNGTYGSGVCTAVEFNEQDGDYGNIMDGNY